MINNGTMQQKHAAAVVLDRLWRTALLAPIGQRHTVRCQAAQSVPDVNERLLELGHNIISVWPTLDSLLTFWRVSEDSKLPSAATLEYVSAKPRHDRYLFSTWLSGGIRSLRRHVVSGFFQRFSQLADERATAIPLEAPAMRTPGDTDSTESSPTLPEDISQTMADSARSDMADALQAASAIASIATPQPAATQEMRTPGQDAPPIMALPPTMSADSSQPTPFTLVASAAMLLHEHAKLMQQILDQLLPVTKEECTDVAATPTD